MELSALIQELKSLDPTDLQILLGALDRPAKEEKLSNLSSTNTNYLVSTSGKNVQNCMNDFSQFEQLYNECIGPMPKIRLRDRDTMISQGVPWQYVEYALMAAAEAPRPSWPYARAVLRRLMTDRPDPDDIDGKHKADEQAFARHAVHTDQPCQPEFRSAALRWYAEHVTELAYKPLAEKKEAFAAAGYEYPF